MQQLPNLHKSTVELLKKGKNLLAFSGGVDSSALFFILKQYDIDFDVAIVDYGIRKQSKQEVDYAQKICSKFEKKFFLHACDLKNSNFEHNARKQRYLFFEKIIKENCYTNLITAHQLNDKLEWFLMQLGRGSGLVEMLGMSEVNDRDNYKLIRPMLHISRKSIQNFLDTNHIIHFVDKSNTSDKYRRNRIRHNYSNSFVDEFGDGLINSFEYLENDVDLLLPKDEKKIEELFILKRNKENLKNIRHIDKIIKKMGILMSKTQREEILRTKNCVISDKIVVVFTQESILISPHVKSNMPKKFKELCRINKIPEKIRPYLYIKNINPTSFFESGCKL